MAGSTSDILCALAILEREGRPLGLHLNLAKCELFSSIEDNFESVVHAPGMGRLSFPRQLSARSSVPNFILLGSPVGDIDFCSQYVAKLRTANSKLLERLSQLEDPQVALHLLRTSASFAKYVYLARTTPPHLIRDSLLACDNDIRASFESFAALQLTDSAWSQAQLSLSMGGLGIRSVSTHCAAAFINSHLRTLPGNLSIALQGALDLFESQLGLGESMDQAKVELMMAKDPSPQRSLSKKLDHLVFRRLLDESTVAHRLRLLSVASPRSGAWLQAMPSRGPFDLTLTPDEMQVLLQHRLGLPLAGPADSCPVRQCGEQLDELGHHQLTCSRAGFVTARHNRIRDALHNLASVAGLNPRFEQGAFAHDRTRPADVLVQAWSLGKPAAFDITVVSPHVKSNLLVAGNKDVVAMAEQLKHKDNDAKCAELGWICIPLAVDSYGCWGEEAHTSFGTIAAHLAVRTRVSTSVALSSIFNSLGLVLARQNARSLLARRSKPHSVGSRELFSLGRR